MPKGAYASSGLTLNGILTALLAPAILHFLGLYQAFRSIPEIILKYTFRKT